MGTKTKLLVIVAFLVSIIFSFIGFSKTFAFDIVSSPSLNLTSVGFNTATFSGYVSSVVGGPPCYE